MARPHRLTSDAYQGEHRTFLTICTYRRQRHFDDPANIRLVMLEFFQTASNMAFDVLAYCVMPDHVHLLVQGKDDSADLSRFVRLAKQRCGYLFKRQTGMKLWQDSYFDRTLRRDEELADAIRYVIENPIRARLVSRPAEYPYWGSAVWSREELLEFIVASESRV